MPQNVHSLSTLTEFSMKRPVETKWKNSIMLCSLSDMEQWAEKITGLLKTRGQLTGGKKPLKFFLNDETKQNFINRNDGYILMSARNNNCGVMTDATYVLM